MMSTLASLHALQALNNVALFCVFPAPRGDAKAKASTIAATPTAGAVEGAIGESEEALEHSGCCQSRTFSSDDVALSLSLSCGCACACAFACVPHQADLAAEEAARQALESSHRRYAAALARTSSVTMCKRLPIYWCPFVVLRARTSSQVHRHRSSNAGAGPASQAH